MVGERSSRHGRRAPRTLRARLRETMRVGPALKLIWESAPRWTVVSAALVVVQSVLPLAALYLMKLVVDGVAEAATGGADGFGRILLLIGLVALVGLLTAGARSLAALASEAQGHLVTDHVLGILHRKSVEVDLEYYEDSRYHDTLHRAQNEAPFRPTRILNHLVQATQSGLTVLGIVGLLFAAHWGVAALVFVAVLPALWVRLRHADRAYEWQRTRASGERRALYLDRLLMQSWHAKEVRLLELGPLLMRRFRGLRERLRDERIALARERSMAEVATQAAAALAVFGSYGIIAYQTYTGALTVGDLVMYFGAVQRGQSLLQSLFTALGGLYEDGLFLSALDDFLELEPRVIRPESPRRLSGALQDGLIVDGVSFRYPSSARPLLEDVSLEVRPGEMVALVGRNGSGKTTLVKLMSRLYDPTAGRITLEGVDLRDLDPAELRRWLTVVFQDYARYQCPASDNVWFGDVERPRDGDAIAEAAREAGADELIRSLPFGYDTMLGNHFEDGEELSTGEWQKVALARALFRGAPLMILDEPTSALDTRSEADFFRGLRELPGDRAVLVISHRFSTVAVADRIYVIDGGRIVEDGTHRELLANGGLYADMYDAQAFLRPREDDGVSGGEALRSEPAIGAGFGRHRVQSE